MKPSKQSDSRYQIGTYPHADRQRKAAGFSLIELTVVGAILVLLTTLSLNLNQNECLYWPSNNRTSPQLEEI